MILDMGLKENLKKHRTARGLTQKQVADHIGTYPQRYGHWETGFAAPDHEMIVTLARFFGVSTDDLLTNGENESIIGIIPTSGVLLLNMYDGVPCGNWRTSNIEPIGSWPTATEQLQGVEHPHINCCWVKVKGGSMEPTIKDGDMVLVANGYADGVTINDGDMVIAVVGNEYTLKRIYEYEDHYQLVPDNHTAHKPLMVKKSDLHQEYSCLYKVLWRASKL